MSLRKLKIPFLVTLVIAILAVAIVIGGYNLQLRGESQDSETGSITASAAAKRYEIPPEFNTLFEVYALLKREHFQRESLDATELSRGAIKGMIEALDDAHALYLAPERHALEAQDFKGFFTGIGAQVTMRDGRITIITPLFDTPAEKAGIRPGDMILEIDGESTDEISLMEAVNKIRGPSGEPVELVILRITGGDPISLTIIRAVVKVESVNLRMLVGQIAHLKINTFTETTDQEVEDALKKVKEFDARGLILDVRNNPGGLLTSVVNVTSQFIEGGLVLYEVDGRGRRRDWPVKSKGLARNIPMVVLVNEGSASGGEVLAGAIIHHGRGPVIGATTFGKGSVNTLRALKDGSGVYYTIALWFTPDGKSIEGEGVEPDIVVAQPEDGVEDLQLDKAIEVLEGRVRALE